jgi:hypothetical protein
MLDILRNPVVLASLISGVIAAVVSSLLVSRSRKLSDRRHARLERAERVLKGSYSPLQAFLRKGSLYGYIYENEVPAKSNRRDFSPKILELMNEAFDGFYRRGITFDEIKIQKKEDDSREVLASIEKELRPLLEAEINRLQAVIQKEAG